MEPMTPPPSIPRARPRARVVRHSPSPPPRLRALYNNEPLPKRRYSPEPPMETSDSLDLIFPMSPVTSDNKELPERTQDPLSLPLKSRRITPRNDPEQILVNMPRFLRRKRVSPLSSTPSVGATQTAITAHFSSAGGPSSFVLEEASSPAILHNHTASRPIAISTNNGPPFKSLSVNAQCVDVEEATREDDLHEGTCRDLKENLAQNRRQGKQIIVGWDGPDTVSLKSASDLARAIPDVVGTSTTNRIKIAPKPRAM